MAKLYIQNTQERIIETLGIEKIYELVAQLAEDAFFIKDSKGCYILVNKKMLEVLGAHSHKKVLGKDDFKILPKDEVWKHIESDQKVLKRAIPIELATSASIRGKRRFFQIKKAPIKNSGKAIGLVGIARDVTDWKKIKEEFEKSSTRFQISKEELVRSEKLAFTGRIAASIAHEVRNPLTNINMSLQQIKKAFTSDAPQKEDIDIIERNVNRVNSLVTELMNCARIQKLQFHFYDIHKILEDILSNERARITHQRVKVVKNFIARKKSPKIELDKVQIERALRNIVTNAIDAMPNGGKLIISTELKDESLIVKFQDTGRGIHEKDIMNIFDLFYTTKPSGMGLGLTICYGIIVSHGGTIGVESKLRKGTIFTVSLPIRQKLRGGASRTSED